MPSAAVLLPLWGYLALVSVPLAVIDLRERRLPDPLVLPGYGFAGVSLARDAAERAGPAAGALAAAALSLATMLLLHIAGGAGLGDVKLAGVLGAGLGLLGWPALGLGAALAFVSAGVAAAVLLVVRGTPARGARIAFGPSLLAGFWGAPLLAAC